MKLSWILGALGAAALCVAAQDPVDGHAFLPPDRWAKLTAEDAGQAFYLDGRWLECSGDEVLLVDLSPEQRGFLYINPNGRLQRRLTQDLTPSGASLIRRKSNARVFGQAKERNGKVVLEVQRVEILPSDAEILIAKLNELGGDDPAPYAELVAEAKRLAKRYDDAELEELGYALARREAQVQAKLVDLGQTDAVLELAQRMVAAKDKLAAIALLSDADKATDDPRAQQRLRTKLEQLGATESGGQWHSKEAFKRAEGFWYVKGRGWVHLEELELEAVIKLETKAQEGKLVIVRENPVEAKRAADSGRLKRGQNAAEARIAAGMPVRTAHTKLRNDLGEEVRWTQWILPDGRRAYFQNGTIVRTFMPESAWMVKPEEYVDGPK